MATILATYAFDYPTVIKQGKRKDAKATVYVMTLDFADTVDKDRYKAKQESTIAASTGKSVYRETLNGVPYYYSLRPLGDTMEMGFSKKGFLFPEIPAEVTSLVDIAREESIPDPKTGIVSEIGKSLSKDAADAMKKHFQITKRRTPREVSAPPIATTVNPTEETVSVDDETISLDPVATNK